MWNDPTDPLFEKRHDPKQGMSDTDMTKFERLGREREPFKDEEPQRDAACA